MRDYCKYCISVVTNGKYSETNSSNKLQLSRHSLVLNKETDNSFYSPYSVLLRNVQTFISFLRSHQAIVKLAVITFPQLGSGCWVLLPHFVKQSNTGLKL